VTVSVRRRPRPYVADALAWVADASRPLTDLTDRDTAKEAVAALKVNRNGKPAAVKTAARRYSTLLSCMGYAVERKLLASNPVAGVKLARNSRTVQEVDPRIVPSLAQARRLLAGAANLKTRDSGRAGHLAVYFAVMYYAGMRPSEVRGLRRVDLDLPEEGWGRALLGESLPQNDGKWSDDGEQFASQPLKHRGKGAVRPVPLPPVLVALLLTTSNSTASHQTGGSSSMAHPAPPSPT
jgi:integrase